MWPERIRPITGIDFSPGIAIFGSARDLMATAELDFSPVSAKSRKIVPPEDARLIAICASIRSALPFTVATQISTPVTAPARTDARNPISALWVAPLTITPIRAPQSIMDSAAMLNRPAFWQTAADRAAKIRGVERRSTENPNEVINLIFMPSPPFLQALS